MKKKYKKNKNYKYKNNKCKSKKCKSKTSKINKYENKKCKSKKCKSKKCKSKKCKINKYIIGGMPPLGSVWGKKKEVTKADVTKAFDTAKKKAIDLASKIDIGKEIEEIAKIAEIAKTTTAETTAEIIDVLCKKITPAFATEIVEIAEIAKIAESTKIAIITKALTDRFNNSDLDEDSIKNIAEEIVKTPPELAQIANILGIGVDASANNGGFGFDNSDVYCISIEFYLIYHIEKSDIIGNYYKTPHKTHKANNILVFLKAVLEGNNLDGTYLDQKKSNEMWNINKHNEKYLIIAVSSSDEKVLVLLLQNNGTTIYRFVNNKNNIRDVVLEYIYEGKVKNLPLPHFYDIELKFFNDIESRIILDYAKLKANLNQTDILLKNVLGYYILIRNDK